MGHVSLTSQAGEEAAATGAPLALNSFGLKVPALLLWHLGFTFTP